MLWFNYKLFWVTLIPIQINFARAVNLINNLFYIQFTNSLLYITANFYFICYLRQCIIITIKLSMANKFTPVFGIFKVWNNSLISPKNTFFKKNTNRVRIQFSDIISFKRSNTAPVDKFF